jgi:hypothetical protein
VTRLRRGITATDGGETVIEAADGGRRIVRDAVDSAQAEAWDLRSEADESG